MIKVQKIEGDNNHLIGKYKNGNYDVEIYDDGTKIRDTMEDDFIPDSPEAMDITITYRCDKMCPYCYMGCNEDGKHFDYDKYIPLLNTIPPYREVAINGNDLSHPHLKDLLRFLKSKNVIVNMTVNQFHFMIYIDRIRELVDKKLIHGLGVSMTHRSPKFIEYMKEFDNAVIHIVNGIATPVEIASLYNKGLKILILGYKNIGRGEIYQSAHEDNIKENQLYIKRNIIKIFKMFDVVSFDNLAIKQLEIPQVMKREEYIKMFGDREDLKFDKVYMGDDGEFTFYIDLVKGTYSRSSLDIYDESKTFKIKEDDTIDSMFKNIKGNII